MNISEFSKKISQSKTIDDNAVGKIMELLLDMPLEKMYAAEMNHIPETGDFDPFAYILIKNTVLRGRINISEYTLREFIRNSLKTTYYGDNCPGYRTLCRNLALWHHYFVPAKYERKEH